MKIRNSMKALFFGLSFLLIGGMIWQMLPQANAGNGGADKKIAAENFSTGGDSLIEDSSLILLNAAQINTKSQAARTLRQPVENFAGKQMHIVKFSGAIQPEWYKMLAESGLEIVNYVPNFAYIVYGDAESLQSLQTKAANSTVIEWDGAYLPQYRIAPNVYRSAKADGKSGLSTANFTIQLFKDSAANEATIEELNRLKISPVVSEWDFQKFHNIIVGLNEDGISQISKRPDVISIQPEFENRKLDERQDRIISGFYTGNNPVFGNYLDYLAGKGFTQAQFESSNFIVNVSDSGIDNANAAAPSHFALRRLGDPAGTSRVMFSRLIGTPNSGSTLQGCDGHGNLNTHIIGGYVPNGAPFNAAPHSDASGYRYGLGVAPFVKVGSSVIFDPNTFTNPDVAALESQAYGDGARISSNSWGNSSNLYQARTQTYDGLVRDAQAGTTGNQELTIVFAAGNDGSAANTVGNPGTGKNVITAGASENVNPFGGADGCAVADSGADSANDMISFSSRGPTSDGRKKPDLVAPGTHVTGGVAQNSNVSPVSGNGVALPCFAANTLANAGVCGGVSSLYFPSTGQQWYTASSGTSHSTPAIAGGAALIRQYFINKSLPLPSPAMVKGLLMNSTNYMNGTGANDNLYSNSQGMGLMNVDRAFSTVDGQKILKDEIAADLFTASGQQKLITGNIASASQPFRVTLAYTDAPGSTTGNAYVNNLDLEVTVGGQTYKGNVFTNGNSVTGGTADVRNNVESVFIPAGVTGAFVVKVKAINIAGDGVPGNASALDQDYALIASNATEAALPVLDSTVAYIAENATPANGTPDPGETVTVNLNLQNIGTANSGTVTATLANSGGITNPSAAQNYGTLAIGVAAVSRPFTFTVPANAVCGSTITLTFQIQEGSNTSTITKQYTLGTLQQSFAQNFDGVTAPVLPTGWTNTAESGASAWVTSTTSPVSTPNSLFVPDPGTVTLTNIETPAFNVASSTATLNFDLNYVTESTYDGAVLEIKSGSGAYQDIIAAGGSFVTGAYNATLSSSFSNPLAGRLSWSGNSGGYIPVSVNLPASINGQSVQLRWRMGTDTSVAATGVYIDNVRVLGSYTCAVVAVPKARADFDGDGKTDTSVFRNGTFHLNRSTAGYTAVQWGAASDTSIGGDFDGDNKADLAVWRAGAPGTAAFFVLNSLTNTVRVEAFGQTGDIPVVADFDGDGKADLATYRAAAQSTFFYRGSLNNPSGNVTYLPFGTTGDTPLVGDFDGDGKADIAVFRNGVWYMRQSTAGVKIVQWGLSTDKLVPADYDGDGKDDIAVFRNGIWYVQRSSDGAAFVTQWGSAGDIAVPGDYDGDGKSDVAIFRNGVWYANRTTAGVQITSFGLAGDIPMPSRYIP